MIVKKNKKILELYDKTSAVDLPNFGCSINKIKSNIQFVKKKFSAFI